MMQNLEFFLNQLKANAGAMELIQKQINETTSFMEETIKGLDGDDKESAVRIKNGIASVFEKAKKGDVSYSAELEKLKQELSKYDKDGSNSNK